MDTWMALSENKTARGRISFKNRQNNICHNFMTQKFTFIHEVTMQMKKFQKYLII